MFLLRNLQWHLKKDTLLLKDLDQATVAVHSLKQNELSKLLDFFSQLPLEFELKTQIQVLYKSQLRGFVFGKDCDLCVLHHKAEGRLFLTDRNGFYNDFLASAYKKTQGRVLVMISNVQEDPPEGALVSSEIYELAEHGDQPTIGILGQLGKVVCYKAQPSAYQVDYISKLISSSAFYREPSEYKNLPKSFHPSQSVFNCDLL